MKLQQESSSCHLATQALQDSNDCWCASVTLAPVALRIVRDIVQTSKSRSPAHNKPADTTQAVAEFMHGLEHSFKPLVQHLREVVLGADPSIAEGIKWNAPSFRTTEYFATTNLRAKAGVGLILHLGAKVRDLPDGAVAIDDPGTLLKWLGKDRAMVEFAGKEELEEKREALVAVLRQWITYV